MAEEKVKEKREENDGDDNEDAGEIDWDLPWVRKKIFSSRSSFFDISGHEEGFTGNPLRGFFPLCWHHVRLLHCGGKRPKSSL